MTEFIPRRPYGDFKAVIQDSFTDFTVDVFHQYSHRFGHQMTVCTPQGPIYITEEQVIAFFGWRSI
jgi:hypothetical protein